MENAASLAVGPTGESSPASSAKAQEDFAQVRQMVELQIALSMSLLFDSLMSSLWDDGSNLTPLGDSEDSLFSLAGGGSGLFPLMGGGGLFL